MTTLEKINEIERRQLELRAVMQRSDEHALKCFKSGLDFRETYPQDWQSYETARQEYNENELVLAELHGQWEQEKEEEASLYERIVKDHEGTESDPIPYAPPMEIFNGKYYAQDDVLYLCTRDSGQALTHNLSELVSLYVEVVS